MYIQNVVFDNVRINAASKGLITNFVNGLEFKNCSFITVPSTKGNAIIPYAATISGINTITGVSTSCTSAVDEINITEKLVYFPNPTNGNHLTLRTEDPMATASIYSLTGAKIEELSGHKLRELQVNVSQIKSGYYVIEVQFVNRTFKTVRFVKE